MLFDKNHFGCATAERLDADCAGSSEDVRESRARHAFSEDIEKCFAQPVAGGAQRGALETLELTAAKCACNHAHRYRWASADVRQMVAAPPFPGQHTQQAAQRILLTRLLSQLKRLAPRQFQKFAVAQRIGHVKTHFAGLP